VSGAALLDAAAPARFAAEGEVLVVEAVEGEEVEDCEFADDEVCWALELAGSNIPAASRHTEIVENLDICVFSHQKRSCGKPVKLPSSIDIEDVD
jgi:hypothetical protein